MTCWILTPVQAEILDLLVRGRGMYGYEMVRARPGLLGERTIHRVLHRMEAAGIVTSCTATTSDDGRPMRVYQPTVLGRRLHATWAANP